MSPRGALIAILIAAACAGAAALALEPFFGAARRVEKRRAHALDKFSRAAVDTRVADGVNRRKQVLDTLKDIETREKGRKASLETRIAQAGLDMGRLQFLLASAACALVCAAALKILGGSTIFALSGMIVGGLGLPRAALSHLARRRLTRFSRAFPPAIDVITRGVKAGLPLADCLRMIAAEADEPVRGEFRQMVESMRLGLSVAEAASRLPEHIPTPEANFFALVIAIQQQTGGNLAEALGNLARVLRERKKLRDKVVALSSEAKASAMIIGALPLIVGLLVYVTSPHYIELLWTTDVGKATLGFCAMMMGSGVLVMKKMIAFDI